mmetsp:Transcript_88214/g.234224  ORF Transcript_88214/g.234224 Transcript_88214/m.234224 type:complete len:224 (+) Transcript_88214:152-823(+)
MVASTLWTTLRDCSRSSSRPPSMSSELFPWLWLATSRRECAFCKADSISSSSSFKRISSSFLSCIFICVRKKTYIKPVVPVTIAGTKRACTPMAVCKKAPRMVPQRNPTKIGKSTQSLVTSSETSALSISLLLRRLQPLLSKIIAALPAVEPMSVAVPVTCVVRTTAPKCMVHMAFCRPQAMAARHPAATARAWVIPSSLTGCVGAIKPDAMSRQLLPTSATP